MMAKDNSEKLTLRLVGTKKYRIRRRISICREKKGKILSNIITSMDRREIAIEACYLWLRFDCVRTIGPPKRCRKSNAKALEAKIAIPSIEFGTSQSSLL